MRNLFKFKDKVTYKFKQSFVVYRINCLDQTSDQTNKSFYTNVVVLLFITKLYIKKFNQLRIINENLDIIFVFW